MSLTMRTIARQPAVCVDCERPIRVGDPVVQASPLAATFQSLAERGWIAHDECPEVCDFCGDPECDAEPSDCMLAPDEEPAHTSASYSMDLHGDLGDTCDACGKPSEDLAVVRIEDDKGNYWDALACPDCREAEEHAK